MTIDGIYMATIEMEKERGAGRMICVAAPLVVIMSLL